MSQLPRALLEYANDWPSGERLGPVSTPEASVSWVNADHGASGDPDRRPSHHPATPVSSTTATVAAILAALPRPGGAGARTAAGAGAPSVRVSASANFSAVAKRSAGSLASALRTACSTPGGTVSRSARGAVGRSVRTLATMVWTVGPVNGGSPTSIS